MSAECTRYECAPRPLYDYDAVRGWVLFWNYDPDGNEEDIPLLTTEGEYILL